MMMFSSHYKIAKYGGMAPVALVIIHHGSLFVTLRVVVYDKCISIILFPKLSR